MVSSKPDEGALCRCVETGRAQPTDASAWQVVDGEERAAASAVQAKMATATDVEAVHLANAKPVQISDVTGPNSEMINGVFEPTGEAHNGRALFQKV